jgi:2-hydroxy-3-oxopropionate reductase
MANIAFLGIGLMGAPMSTRLHQAGHQVTVWNRSREKAEALRSHGLIVATSAVEAVKDAEFVISMLTNGEAVLHLLNQLGIAAAMQKGASFIDMSSIAPSEARLIDTMLGQKSVAALDAPVSGGTVGAEHGTLAIMVGGDKTAFERALPIFEPMGRATYVGPSGAGQVAKLCNQQIVAITIGAVAEALHLAERSGADPAAMRAAIRGGFAESRILELHGQRMLDRNFTPGGRSSVQLKDLTNILNLAAETQTATPLSQQLFDRFQRLVTDLSGADLDHSALLLELEDRSKAGI